MRGFVACACCGEAITACWSKGRSRRYGYYLCDTKGRPEARKSFRKETVEGELEALLTTLRRSCATSSAKVDQLLDRLLEASGAIYDRCLRAPRARSI
ncbi:MAG TPA: recombinase zinc beta ribbon domain-containing protein [Hyphomicrobiaceae bacterium]|nr:recombinase zinc beta ribbon domain-containing protein [Hyphomicrobiaceae bacterium]